MSVGVQPDAGAVVPAVGFTPARQTLKANVPCSVTHSTSSAVVATAA